MVQNGTNGIRKCGKIPLGHFIQIKIGKDIESLPTINFILMDLYFIGMNK